MTLDWLLVCATLTGIFVLGFVLGIAVQNMDCMKMITDSWPLAAGLLILSVAGFFFMIKMQDKWIDKIKDRYDDDGGMMH